MNKTNALLVILLALATVATARADEPAATQAVQLPYNNFRDSFGTQWIVLADGSLGPNDADIYDAGGRLFLGQNEQYGNVQAAQFDAARNELVLPPQPLSGLNVSRRISVDNKEGFCRWTEVLENASGSPIKSQLHLSFNTGSAVQSSQEVSDPKTHKPIGLAIFDGARGIAMLGAGHGGKVVPTLVPQQGQAQVDLTWDVEVPAHKTVAIIHVQAVRPTVNDAQAFLEKFSDKQVLHGLPASLARVVLNFPGHTSAFGDMELLRGDLQDAVELRSGDQFKGTIQEKTFALQTTYGPVTLPAEKVLAWLHVGDFRPTQLLITRDGEAFSGVLQSPVVHVALSSGQVTAVPVDSIRRLGFHKLPNEPEDFKYTHPMLMLRNGDRIAVELPAGPMAVSTRYGKLLLKPQCIGALVFQAEQQPMHQLLLTDGSRIAALIDQDALELRPISIGAESPIRFPLAGISRVQFVQKIDEPGEQSPVLTLSTGDRLAGAIAGKLELETAFDTIAIDGAEIRGMHLAGSAPTEVQVTLWDDSSLSGRLKGDAIRVALQSGPELQVPVALIDSYTHPEPMPPASVVEKVRTLVVDLGSAEWKRADRATAELHEMGPHVGPVLKSLKTEQSKAVQGRIDLILGKFEEKPAPQTKPAANDANVEPAINDRDGF